MCTKKFLKVFGLLLVVGLLFAVAPTGQAQAADPCTTACYVSPSGDDTSTGLEGDPFLTIQKAIDTVSDGGTIYLTAGNYVENPITTITLNKSFSLIGANDGSGTALSTIQGTLSLENSLSTDSYLIEYINFKQVSGTDSLVIKQIDNLTVRNSVFAGAGTVTGRAIQMNTGSNGNQNILIDNCRFENLYYTGIQGSVNNLTVKDSEFLNLKSGINLQSGGSDLTVTDSTFSVVAQGAGNDTYGIRLASDTAGTGESLNVTGSTFTVDKAGLVADPGTYHAAIIIRAGALGPFTVEENQILGDVFNLTTLPLDISPNWWGSADGPAAGQLVGTATYIPWCGDAACENLITPTVHNTTKGTWHVTIQGAIDAAADGDVIEVGPGTYAENVVINKPNLTLQSSGTAEETIVLAPTGVGISVLKELGTVTVDGFTVESWTTAGISQSWTQRAGTTFIVKNNIVNGTGDEVHGNCIQVTGDDSLVEGNVVDGAYYTGTGEYGASGILVYLANNAIVRNNVVTNADIGIAVAGGGAYGQSSMTGALVIDNEVSLSEIGISVSFDANNTTIQDNFVHDNELGLLEEYNWGYGPTGTIALHNQVVDNTEQALTESYDETTPIPSGHIFMAEANWWGSIAGPSETEINEYVDYAPWCGDAECSFLVYPMLSTGLQASIDATPAGGTLYVPAGTYTDGGTDGYNVAGKTIILGDGVIIQNSSPCFTVEDSYSTITTETIGGATCAPTITTGEDYGSSGIDVNGGLSNIVIEGIYFDTDQVSEALGVISFNGTIEDVLINDNYFRADAAIVYDGIIFAQQPTGVVEIKGNFFEMPHIGGCAVNNFFGTSTIDAQFNSFGSMSGHPASVPDERICENVDYSNYTHADVYLESSATPWLNQEVVGQKFTLTVKANLTKVTGAKFTLKYNPALVDLDAATLTNLSGFSPAGPNMFEVDETLGLITFNASAYPAITGTAYSLFSADFTASAVGSALFEVDALTDEFAMFPGYASSSNVYGYTLLPVTVDLIKLPTVASTFGDSYYLVGEARDFTMTVTNYDTAYAAPELRITIPTGLTLKYNGTDYTSSLVVDLADLAVDEVVTIDLTATFTAPFNTTAAVLDVDLVDALTPEELLVDTSFSAFAYTKPTVTIGTDPYFLVGVPGDFSVTIMNPETGRNYGDSIVFDIVIEDHVVEDISAVSCTMGTQTWDLIGELEQDDTNVVARIEGLTGGFFTVPANFTAPISCSITYATPGTYAVSGYMVEGISLPERIVSDTYSATAQVYTQPVISSDNLDGPFQAGLAQDVTLNITNPSGIPEPFDLVFTLPEGTVIQYNGTEYTCLSTGCPVIPLDAGAVPGDIDFTITFPVGFVGGTADISVSLYDRDTVGAPSPLATLSLDDVVVYANVAAVTGTVSMQGRTTRAGVLYTLAGSFDTYTATSINTLSDNISFANLASGEYAITVEQARYLDITIAHGATIDLATLQAIANLELRAGDANDDNTIGPSDASIVGAQYGTGTIADNGDINFDNRVNIQDLALIGGNYDQQSVDPSADFYAYRFWMQ